MHHMDVLFLCETKTGDDQMEMLRQKLKVEHMYVVEFIVRKGGLALL